MWRIMDIRVVAALSLFVAVPAVAQSPMFRVPLAPVDSVASLTWTSLASDATGDGLQRRLPDAKELSFAIDQKGDLVWFKVSLNGAVPERWFGINVAIDIDESSDNGMAWWGTNKVKFDLLATAYLSKGEDDWQGYAGVADSDSVAKGYMSNLTRAVNVAVDRQRHAILLGVPRYSLGTVGTIRVIATVGSMLANNDDVPNEGMVTVKLNP